MRTEEEIKAAYLKVISLDPRRAFPSSFTDDQVEEAIFSTQDALDWVRGLPHARLGKLLDGTFGDDVAEDVPPRTIEQIATARDKLAMLTKGCVPVLSEVVSEDKQMFSTAIGSRDALSWVLGKQDTHTGLLLRSIDAETKSALKDA